MDETSYQQAIESLEQEIALDTEAECGFSYDYPAMEGDDCGCGPEEVCDTCRRCVGIELEDQTPEAVLDEEALSISCMTEDDVPETMEDLLAKALKETHHWTYWRPGTVGDHQFDPKIYADVKLRAPDFWTLHQWQIAVLNIAIETGWDLQRIRFPRLSKRTQHSGSVTARYYLCEPRVCQYNDWLHPTSLRTRVQQDSKRHVEKWLRELLFSYAGVPNQYGESLLRSVKLVSDRYSKRKAAQRWISRACLKLPSDLIQVWKNNRRLKKKQATSQKPSLWQRILRRVGYLDLSPVQVARRDETGSW